MIEKLRDAWNNRYIGLSLLSVEMIVEFLQVLPFIADSAHPNGDGWNDSASDFIGDLKDLVLITPDENEYTAAYVVSCVFIGIIFTAYVALNSQVHKYNQKDFYWTSPVFVIADHVIIGLGFVIMVSILTDTLFCNESSNLTSDTSVNCWTSDHLAIIQFGLIFSGLALIISAGFCVILRAERRGVERPFGNDLATPVLYKILVFFIVFFLPHIREPYLGIVFVCMLVFYVAVYEGYQEIHVASLRLAVLVGFFWAFVCAETTEYHSEDASNMLLYGWPFSLILGYSILYLKSFLIERKPLFNSVLKN